MLYRTPVETESESFTFYNEEYSEGFTTDLPSTGQLAVLRDTGFAGSEKDYSYCISVLKGLGLDHGARLFDFGCSWGYGSFQFAQAGYDVTAFEISRPRRDYGIRHLGVRAVDSMEAFAAANAGQFDCFFSAHVLEHVPAPSKVFEMAFRMLKPGGLFVSFTPNGSAEHRAVNPHWSNVWSQVHPNAIDDVFLCRALPTPRKLLASTPFAAAPIDSYGLAPGEAWNLGLTGDELVFVASKSA